MKGVINMSGKPNRNRQYQLLVRLNQKEYEKLTRLVFPVKSIFEALSI